MSGKSSSFGDADYDDQIPSRIKDRDWMTTGLNVVVNKKKVGKWMVFLNDIDKDEERLTRLDRAWLIIVDMVRKGVIIGAGCSTGACAYNSYGKKKCGVINCYTSDFTDMDDVQRTAEEIHKSLDYRGTLFYKTNADTKSSKFRDGGSKNVSLYLHTQKCGLLVKNSSGDWVKPGQNSKEREPQASHRRGDKEGATASRSSDGKGTCSDSEDSDDDWFSNI